MEIKRVVELRKARGEGSISPAGLLTPDGRNHGAGWSGRMYAGHSTFSCWDAGRCAGGRARTGDARSDLLERFDRAGW